MIESSVIKALGLRWPLPFGFFSLDAIIGNFVTEAILIGWFEAV